MKDRSRPDDAATSAKITKRIQELGDWRGETLAHLRQLIHDADAEIQQEWKWEKPNRGLARAHCGCWLAPIESR